MKVRSLLLASVPAVLIAGIAASQFITPIQTTLNQVTATGASYYRAIADYFSDNLAVTDFGLVPISVNGETDCTWATSAGITTVTCPAHAWTAQEQALLKLNPTNFKVDLGEAGVGGADLHTYITSFTTGSTSFVLHDAATTDKGTGANKLAAVTSLTPVVQGSGYKIGATVTASSAGVTQSVSVITGKVADLVPDHATIANNGNLGGGAGTGTADCSLSPTLSPIIVGGAANTTYAQDGVQAVAHLTITAGVVTAATVSGGHYERISSAYAYAAGFYGAMPVSSTVCSNVSGGVTVPLGVTLNISFAPDIVQDSSGLDATSGIFTANGNNSWCSNANPDATTSSDSGTGLTVKCGVQQAHVWAGFDNQARLGALFDTITATPQWQRTAIQVCPYFYTSPVLVSAHPIIGAASFVGCGMDRSGFFEPSNGTFGEVFPFVDVGQNGADSPTGTSISDNAAPDQSGARVQDMTFLGEQTGTKSSTQSVSAIRFYGSSGRSRGIRISARNLPGCLVCGGADAGGTGTLSEFQLIQPRYGASGDSTSRTPVVGLDAVGSTAGTNNILVQAGRGTGNFGATIAVRGATGSGGGSLIRLVDLKDEAGGNDQFNQASDFIDLNYDCDGTLTGIPYSFPQYNGIGNAVTIITSSAGGGTLCGGIADTVISGSLTNVPLGRFAVVVGGLHKLDVDAIRLDDLTLSSATGSGGGVLVNACNKSCSVSAPKISAMMDYGLIVSASPNANTIATNAIELDVPIAGQAGILVDAGVTVYCNDGAGKVLQGTGVCAGDLANVTGAFADGTLQLSGSSSGTGTIKAPAAASNYSWTLPAAIGTLAESGSSGSTACLANATCTISNVWTFNAGDFVLGTGVQNDFVIFDVNHAASDSGVLISAKANLVSPSFTTPTLGDAVATTINKVTITGPVTGATLTLINGKTFTVNNTLTLSGTDNSTLNIGAGGTLASLAYLSTINNGNWSGAGLALTNLAVQATNTVLANVSVGSATPTAFSMSSCVAATCALGWQTNVGFVLNSSINAGTLGGATFAAPGAIGGTTPAAGSFSGLTLTGAIAMGGNNISGGSGFTSNSANGYKLISGAATATSPSIAPNTADNTTGIGGASGHVSLIGAGAQVFDIASTGSFFKTITTGTNADTLCMATGGLAQIQASTCTISDKNEKNLWGKFKGDALYALDHMTVWDFSFKKPNPDPNGNTPTIGLTAQGVAQWASACSIYYTTKKGKFVLDKFGHRKPKSYKPECLIGMLVKGMQQQQREIVELQRHSP